MKIKLMNPEDLSQVAEIEKQIFSVPWSEKAFKESVESENTIYIVAKENEKVLGYAGMYVSFEEGSITNIAVDIEVRRRGIGRKLIADILDKANERGVEKIFLEVRETNEPAIALYEKMGFEKNGIRKNFYEKPLENAIIMWKHQL